jgi:ABC-type multidrug transport system ATPase subunit
VRIEHGVIRRGGKIVLDAGRVELPDRGTVAVIGANGAGKSSLFLALTDSLLYRRHGLRFEPAWHGTSMFCMPQAPALPPWLTAEAVARLYGQDIRMSAQRFPRFRLEEIYASRVRNMSGGQRQILMLALALSATADITILDEPLASLDLPRRHAALQAIGAARPGLTLMSSQSAADVIDCCDWYIVLRAGRYAFCGPVEELLGEEWRMDATRQARLEARLLELSGFAPVA